MPTRTSLQTIQKPIHNSIPAFTRATMDITRIANSMTSLIIMAAAIIFKETMQIERLGGDPAMIILSAVAGGNSVTKD